MPTHTGKLPVYELVINEDEKSKLEVDFIALVDRPAIERDFMKFNEDTPIKMSFASVDEDRFIISGPAMLADVPIYRKDEDGTEYYVVFKEATIYKIAQKFLDKKYNKNFNIMHSAELEVEGVSVFESFIVDSNRGIAPMRGFEDAKNGSWFISAKVDNAAVWDEIKAGTIKGFSVQGNFGFTRPVEEKIEVEDEDTEQMQKIIDILNEVEEE